MCINNVLSTCDSAAQTLEFAFLPREFGAGFRPEFDTVASGQMDNLI